MQLKDLSTDCDSWQFSQSEFIVEACYFLATSAAKISILMFYLRIFTGRKFKIIAASLIAVCTQYGVITAMFGCRPIPAGWELTTEGSICIDRLALYYAKHYLGHLYRLFDLCTTAVSFLPTRSRRWIVFPELSSLLS